MGKKPFFVAPDDQEISQRSSKHGVCNLVRCERAAVPRMECMFMGPPPVRTFDPDVDKPTWGPDCDPVAPARK